MLGMGTSLSSAATALLTYVKDNLKLYMPFGAISGQEVKFVGTGSTSFDGTDDIVDLGNDSSLQITGALSVSAWVKTVDDGANHRFITKYDGTNKCFYVSIQDSGGVFRLNVTNSNTEIEVNGTSNNLDDQWHHVVAVFTPSVSLAIYVDGLLENTNTSSVPATIDNDTVDLTFGGEEDKEVEFTGSMKNVGIWSRVLTQTEIQNVMYKTYGQLLGTETQGLVSWWALDSSTNTYNDSHGSNHGTAEGNTVLQDGIYGGYTPKIPRAVDNAPTARADMIGNGSASFTASNTDYIDVGTSSTLSFAGTDPFSICVWVKYDTTATRTIIGRGTAGGADYEWRLFTDGSSYLTFACYTPNASAFIGRSYDVAVTTGKWYHVSATYDGGTSSSGFEIYLDGVAVSDADYESNPESFSVMTDNSGDTIMGKYSNYFDGNIAQVGIWSATLTQAQIQEVKEKSFTELSVSDKTNLVSYWSLDEDANDDHGSNHGTLT